jgi:hypothetical protein
MVCIGIVPRLPPRWHRRSPEVLRPMTEERIGSMTSDHLRELTDRFEDEEDDEQ